MIHMMTFQMTLSLRYGEKLIKLLSLFFILIHKYSYEYSLHIHTYSFGRRDVGRGAPSFAIGKLHKNFQTNLCIMPVAFMHPKMNIYT